MKKALSICTAAMLLLLSACSSTHTDEPPDVGSDVPHNSSTAESESTTNSSAGSTTNTSSTTEPPESSDTENSIHTKPSVDPGENNGEMSGNVLVLNNGRGLVLYGGGYENGRKYAETLNKYKEILGTNVNVFSMVVPTAVSFYLPEKYSDWSASEWDNIENINDHLDGVIPVDAYTEMAKHTGEEIYLRTDNHWTSLGAYYAAREFAKTALVDSFPELNEDNYEFISRDGYVGMLYGYSNEAPEIKNNPETFTYYKPKTTYTTDYYSHGMEFQYTGALMLNIDNIATNSWYLVNMCGDMYTAHVKTECKNARKLLIVKDSYGDALPAFLTSSFEDIWVVDMRYFEKSVTELAKSEGITDVLFAMNPLSATGENAKNLSNIM